MKEILLYESKNSKIFLTDGRDKGTQIITKILNQEFPASETINQFYNEYELTHGLSIQGVRKCYEKERIKNRHAIIMEYIPGISLSEKLTDGFLDLKDFLEYAIKIATIIGEVHKVGIIHKDINSQNIIIDESSGEVFLIDFGISTTLDLKNNRLENPEKLEGSLLYISPEQTGRMNRMVDYRTDLYSLGITFYEMLTGKVPFQSDDAMELVHAHIASIPPPISSFRKEVPPVLEIIIDKLIAKDAEARYQSTIGLIKDLEYCLHSLKQTGKIEYFDICQHDFSGDFKLPQKLYGRDMEYNKLMEAFDRVSSGHSEILLVGGYSGTGKSALVHEIHRPITGKRAYFIEGKFDQFQKSVPYFGFIQAFTSFVSMLLTEKKELLESTQEKILVAVGDEGKVLTDIITNLTLLIGTQPDIPKLGGLESQNRLNYLFSSFIQAITAADHPIVLFIDDMQWADSASLSLLSSLMSNTELKYLLCICAYRDNEVSMGHPFISTINDLRKKGANINEINVDNLKESDVQQLISDATRLPMVQTAPLANLVYEKTQGNAFFVTQFLKKLADESLLHFNHHSKEWQWDLKKIHESDITDNVVDMLANKITLLPEQTKEILKVAACIGSQFDIETLIACHHPVTSTAEFNTLQRDTFLNSLQQAMAAGYIMPVENRYRFTHDRIQQAVYSLIHDEDKAAAHYKIGSLLLNQVSEDQLENQLFEIVNQLNQGIDLIESEDEKEVLANLNLRAGLKAKDSSAFQPAISYFETGIDLLKQDHWNSQYEQSISLYTEAAETAYNMGEFGTMEEKLKAVLENHKELMDVVRPYAIRINALKAQNKLQEAIDTGLDVLSQLGEKFPKKGRLPLVMADLIHTKLKLLGKDHEVICNLPTMANPYKAAALRILNDIASPVYWARPGILPFIIFRMVRLSLKYGVTEISAFGFATYGLLMCGVLGDMKSGYQYGQIGLALLDRFEAKRWLSQIYTPIYALINHWSEHVHKSLDPFLYSYKVGFETGAIEYACINVNIYCNHSYLGGKPLVQCEREMKMFSEQMLKYKQETNYNYNEAYRQAALNLLGLSEDPTKLSGEAYDEKKMAPIHEERKDRAGTFLIHSNNLMLNYLFHEYDEALRHASLTRPLLDAVLAKYDVAIFWYYEALVNIAVAREKNDSKSSAYIRRAKKNIVQFKKWAKYCPVNHQHKLDLLLAEMAWYEGKTELARKHYDLSIKGADVGEFLNEEALALERAGHHYLSTGYEFIAEHYIRKAFQTYTEWGANAKAADLKQRFPKILLGLETENETTSGGPSAGVGSSLENQKLDLESLIKAAQAISGEVVWDKLLKTLLTISIKNAGAQSGCIILKKGKDWDLTNLYFADVKDPSHQIDTLIHQSDRVPESLISYILNTKQSLVLDDISRDNRFMSDAIVKSRGLKSVLCLPMFNKGIIEGLLYLENNLQNAVFTESRVRFLELLSGQIAISLENAQLYENLESKIDERTAELKASLDNLKTTQEQLIRQEKLASLGELTAGIAHEIQNPLNFVNNFSEVSSELLDELREELKKGDLEEVQAIVDDIKSNLEKINDHGKRASSIIKSMLEHSRMSTGQKELCDINTLCEEYIRLAYHGLKAKDSSFNAVYETILDASLPKIKVMPQEISRVLLNIINNAFFACTERSRSTVNEGANLLNLDEHKREGNLENLPYQPKVVITTKKLSDKIEISITDNGPGIPDEIKDKILQPFFTTKKGKDGTGLGLSITHDIIKAHGGELSIQNNHESGVTFVISLPKE
jgi:histidine kinase